MTDLSDLIQKQPSKWPLRIIVGTYLVGAALWLANCKTAGSYHRSPHTGALIETPAISVELEYVDEVTANKAPYQAEK